MSTPRFEVVRTGGHYSAFAGRTIGSRWHARFRGANGRIVWTTETYTRRRAALAAIELLSSGPATLGVDDRWRIRQRDSLVVEIRDVDERSAQ